jgi:hypothetical protein
MIFVFGAKILRTKNLSAKILGAKVWRRDYDDRGSGDKG